MIVSPTHRVVMESKRNKNCMKGTDTEQAGIQQRVVMFMLKAQMKLKEK